VMTIPSLNSPQWAPRKGKQDLFFSSLDLLVADPQRRDPLYTTVGCSNSAWLDYIHSLPTNLRSEASALRRMGQCVELIEEKGRCYYCWFHQSICVCAMIRALAGVGGTGGSPPSLQFTILMHPREFSRASNTGKILGLLFGAEVLVPWLPNTEKRLRELQNLWGAELCVMYPQAVAFEVSPLGAEEGEKGCCPIRRFSHVILIDATWNEASKLNRMISPDIPRVAISPEFMSRYTSLFAPLRDRSRESGVSTAEAAALLLRQPACVEAVMQSMRIMVDALCLEKCVRPLPYGVLSEDYIRFAHVAKLERQDIARGRLDKKSAN